jgi:hypothetical protein
MNRLPQKRHFSEEKKYPRSTAMGNNIRIKRNGNRIVPITAIGHESCLLDF